MLREYFHSLNYTIGNEDASLELAVMPEGVQHAFVVAGSGSRIIPLLSKGPKYITCVDFSQEQLSLTELRIASLKMFDHQNFLAFWGYPPYSMTPNERALVFKNLELSQQSKKIMELLFQKCNWGPLLYAGRWEKTFCKLSKINRWIVGSRGLGIFSCRTQEEQEEYMKTKFPHKAWSFVVFMLGNAFVFNTLLYKGEFPQKNISESIHLFYSKRFEKLFKQNIARKNYFLQLLFFGKLQFPEGLPIECDQGVFLKAKKELSKTKITYIHNDIIEEVKRSSVVVDFLSLSNVPSYLHPPREQEFLQEIRNKIARGGIMVNRYYLRIPTNLKTGGYQEITHDYLKSIAEEKIQMYSFGIYKKV